MGVNAAYLPGMQIGDRALPGRARAATVKLGLERAAELSVMVRDESREAVGEWLDRLDRQALYAVTVTLAAMVDPELPLDELLEWVDGPALDDPAQDALFE